MREEYVLNTNYSSQQSIFICFKIVWRRLLISFKCSCLLDEWISHTNTLPEAFQITILHIFNVCQWWCTLKTLIQLFIFISLCLPCSVQPILPPVCGSPYSVWQGLWELLPWQDHWSHGVRWIPGGRQGCLSGIIQFLCTLIKAWWSVNMLSKKLWSARMVEGVNKLFLLSLLLRVTLVVLWCVTGSYRVSSPGVMAALSPTTLAFTPKSALWCPGSTKLLLHTARLWSPVTELHERVEIRERRESKQTETGGGGG